MNSESQSKRDFYHKCKKLINIYKTQETKSLLIKSSTDFKNTGKKTKYKQNLAITIRHLRTDDPKKFWKLLQTRNSNESQSLRVIHNSNNVDESNILNNDTEKIHAEVNADFVISWNNDITDEDIRKGIQEFKTGKACGIDLIYDECFKSFCDIRLTLYGKLFNVSLDTGAVPKSWPISQIIPI